MTNEEISARFDEGSRQFEEIRGQLAQISEALKPIPEMRSDIETAKNDSATVKEIVQAWNAVKTGGKFVRWVAPIVVSIGAAWAAVKMGIVHILGR